MPRSLTVLLPLLTLWLSLATDAPPAPAHVDHVESRSQTLSQLFSSAQDLSVAVAKAQTELTAMLASFQTEFDGDAAVLATAESSVTAKLERAEKSLSMLVAGKKGVLSKAGTTPLLAWGGIALLVVGVGWAGLGSLHTAIQKQTARTTLPTQSRWV